MSSSIHMFVIIEFNNVLKDYEVRKLCFRKVCVAFDMELRKRLGNESEQGTLGIPSACESTRHQHYNVCKMKNLFLSCESKFDRAFLTKLSCWYRNIVLLFSESVVQSDL